MDDWMRLHRGVRQGRLCPCCAETPDKRRASRLVRARMARQLRALLREEG